MAVHVGFTWANIAYGPGYLGCYPVGPHWQNILEHDYNTSTSVDTCLLHCRNKVKRFAFISRQTCFCSAKGPSAWSINAYADNNCNMTCPGNPYQRCGSHAYYSVFRTDVGFCNPLDVPDNGWIDQSLSRVGTNVTFSCSSGFELKGPNSLQCILDVGKYTSAVWSDNFPTCLYVDRKGLHWDWKRIAVGVAVIAVISLLVILVFLHRKLRSTTGQDADYTDIPGPRSSLPIQGVNKSSQTLLVGGTREPNSAGTTYVSDPMSSNSEMSGLAQLSSEDGLNPMDDVTASSNIKGHTYSRVITGPTASVDSVTPDSSMSSDSDGSAAVNIIHSYAIFTTTGNQATSTTSEEHKHHKAEVTGWKKGVEMDKDGYAQLLIRDSASSPDQNAADVPRITTTRSGSQMGGITQEPTGSAHAGMKNEDRTTTIPLPTGNYENRDVWRPRGRQFHRK